MITTEIRIKPHLAEYVFEIFGDKNTGVVFFPLKTDISYTISSFLIKRPCHVFPTRGNITIKLPHRSWGNNPHRCNYISKNDQQKLGRKIEIMFWAHCHNFMKRKIHKEGYLIKDAAYLFMLQYKINSITHDAVLKNYYRYRCKQKEIKKKLEDNPLGT